MRRAFQRFERMARWALAVATYHVNPSYVERGRRLYPLLFADSVFAAMRRARVSCALDVGAHRGEFALTLRRAGYNGAVVSFEPNPDAARILRVRARRDGAWWVHDYALGRETADAVLHRPAETPFASLRPTLPYGPRRFGSRVEPRDAIQVRVRRLDDVFDAVAPRSVNPAAPGPLLLKIDTQGSDLDVLEGAARILPFVAVLVMEFSLIPLYEGAPRLPEVLQYVEAAGFSLLAAVPVGHDTTSGTVIELDGCLVRGSAPGFGSPADPASMAPSALVGPPAAAPGTAPQ
jgi:FkbM family methyltransferase